MSPVGKNQLSGREPGDSVCRRWAPQAQTMWRGQCRGRDRLGMPSMRLSKYHHPSKQKGKKRWNRENPERIGSGLYELSAEQAGRAPGRPFSHCASGALGVRGGRRLGAGKALGPRPHPGLAKTRVEAAHRPGPTATR